jgi:plastocyanin
VRLARATALVPACLVPAALAAGCGGAPPAAGTPTVREFTITAVPLLTREMQRIYPFLAKDFAAGGVLEGKEVYAFEPSAITVYEGDTIHFTLVNPEDDQHSFVLPPDLSLALPPQSRVAATYVARHAGSFRYFCAIASHLPFMYGTLIVLPARDRPARWPPDSGE